jgi:hypothetical protein
LVERSGRSYNPLPIPGKEHAMSRSVFLRVLAAVVLAGLGIAPVAIWCYRYPDEVEIVPVANLAAPLPAESAADLAAAMPAIDELRQHRGSLLDGSLLESLAAPERHPENSYVDLLRREARRLDGLAADDEDIGQFDSADNLRTEAHQLRLKAREAEEPVIQFGSHAINR